VAVLKAAIADWLKREDIEIVCYRSRSRTRGSRTF
jgi:hypothetical protein